jgi:hypothetical protein
METGENEKISINKATYVKEMLKGTTLYEQISEKIREQEHLLEDEQINLDTLMQGFILESLTNTDSNTEIDLTEIVDSDDMEINTYI